MASMTACGCGSQAVDPAPDIFYDVVDPAPDVIDTPMEVPDGVDPAPDVIDMTPDPEDEDVDEDVDEDAEEDAAEDSVEAALPHSFIRTRLRHEQVAGGVKLEVDASRAGAPTFAWAASGGELRADGASALWHPPSEPGVHAVQVTVRSGEALSIETYKITKA
jgi:hypothetical protein